MYMEFVNRLCIGCFHENGHVRRHDIVLIINNLACTASQYTLFYINQLQNIGYFVKKIVCTFQKKVKSGA